MTQVIRMNSLRRRAAALGTDVAHIFKADIAAEQDATMTAATIMKTAKSSTADESPRVFALAHNQSDTPNC